MKVLGFDPSLTNFGWALHDTDAEGRARCVARGRFQTPAKMLFVQRYMTMRANVTALLAEHDVDFVGCESPVFNDLWSEGMYGLFLYTCEALYEAGVNLVLFSPIQVKAHARNFLDRPVVAGKKWVMRKPDMVEAARLHTGGKGRWNHNEADAYWVAVTAGRFWQLLQGVISEADLTADERRQFTRIHTYQRGKKAGKTERKGLIFREDDRFFLWAVDDDE